MLNDQHVNGARKCCAIDLGQRRICSLDEPEYSRHVTPEIEQTLPQDLEARARVCGAVRSLLVAVNRRLVQAKRTAQLLRSQTN